MKISIILGVLHMLFGVFLSLGNHKYFGESISIWAEFVPQVIFLLGMFGYLAFLMIIKWWIYYATNVEANLPNSQGCAPSVLITFIGGSTALGDPIPTHFQFPSAATVEDRMKIKYFLTK